MMTRLFPHPDFTLLLAVIWLLLAHSLSLGNIVLALFAGWAIPFLSEKLWPRRPPIRHPLLMVRYALVLLKDIVVANMIVVPWVLGPAKRLKPAFVVYPLALRDRHAIAALASSVSLTPGTVSADVSLTRQALLIHTLHVEDEAVLIESIRKRYEMPLKEIFE